MTFLLLPPINFQVDSVGSSCYELNCVLPNSYAVVLNSLPQNMILFGNKVFAHNRVKMSLLVWALIRHDICTGRMPSEDEGRDLGNVSTSRTNMKVARSPPEVRRVMV